MAANFEPRQSSTHEAYGGRSSAFESWLLVILLYTMADEAPMSMMSMSSLMSMSMMQSAFESLPTPTLVDPDVKYACIKCGKTLMVPQQTPCGHRIDLKCIKEMFEGLDHNATVMCPAKEEECTEFALDTIHPDFSVMREMRLLKVYCIYRQQGCDEIVALLKLKEHISTCLFRLEQCRSCQGKFPFKLIQKHVDTECPEVYCQCPFLCPEAPSDGIKRGEMDSHFERCTAKPRKCTFSTVGCQFESHAAAMETHAANELKLHLNLLLQRFASVHAENTMLRKKLEDAGIESGQNADKQYTYDSDIYSMQSLYEENTKLRHSLETFREELDQIKDKQAELLAQQNAKLQQLEASLKFLAGSIAAKTTGQTTSGTFVASHLSEQKLAQLESRQVTLERTFKRFDVEYQCLATANREGVLLFCIHDYSRRKAAAVSGQTPSIFSQPFYTHPYGYKLCARVYLNGEGAGINRYLSLFIVVMKGDFDNLLDWPFQQTITLSIIDQSKGPVRRDHKDAFKPDASSSSFARPVGEMNVASGSPKFIEQKVLEAVGSPYLRDDTLVIKVVVDTTNAFAW